MGEVTNEVMYMDVIITIGVIAKTDGTGNYVQVIGACLTASEELVNAHKNIQVGSKIK